MLGVKVLLTNKKITLYLLVVILVLSVVTLGVDACGGLATNLTVVSVCPSEITVRKYETFSINVTIANVTDLCAYQFELYYSSSVLKCTGIKLPSSHFLEPSVDPNMIFIVRLLYDNRFNATHGLVWVAMTLLADEPCKNGSGTLATINFTATEVGVSTLDLKGARLVGGYEVIYRIPFEVVNGYVNVLPPLTGFEDDKDGDPLTPDDIRKDYTDDLYKDLIRDLYGGYNSRGYAGSTYTQTEQGYGGRNWNDDSVDNPYVHPYEPYVASIIILLCLSAFMYAKKCMHSS